VKAGARARKNRVADIGLSRIWMLFVPRPKSEDPWSNIRCQLSVELVTSQKREPKVSDDTQSQPTVVFFFGRRASVP
jgi:hypothetical protein